MQYVSTIPCFTYTIKVTRVSFSRRGHKIFTHFTFRLQYTVPISKVGTYDISSGILKGLHGQKYI